MNKALEALERIKSHYNDRVCIDILEDFDLIETALKRLEQLERAFDTLVKENETVGKMLSREIEKNRAFEIIKKRECLFKGLSEVDQEEFDIIMKALRQ